MLPLVVTIGGLAWEPWRGSQTLRPSTRRPNSLASPFGDFGTRTFPTTPARDARALALGLARRSATRDAGNEGTREARGAGGVAVLPEAPTGGAGGLPTRPEPETPATITAVRRMADGFLLRLEGISTRKGAAALTGRKLWLQRATLPPLGAGEFYVEDLLGCMVETREGHALGVVCGVFWNGAHDVMVIGDGEQGEWLLPAVPEFIVAIDPLGKRVLVNPHE